MKTKKKRHYVYTNINVQSVALILIADLLNFSKYGLFLLYETFGNDCFLFIDICKKAGLFKTLTDFRLRRCFQQAEVLTPMLLGKPKQHMSTAELRAYRMLMPMLFENKLRIEKEEEFCS